MLTSQEIQDRLERILLTVQKPGRYVGGELHQVNKPWDSVAAHVALVFPDIYDLGLPNLGLAILYNEINRRADALAERAYAPWVDMEDAMRSSGIPLYGLESKHPLAAFDLIGFSLPYESLYTNVLNLLDLAQIPLRSADRTREHPLIIAGGHAAFNPEPMHAFIDAFAVGEGEEVIHEIIDAQLAWRASGEDRPALLRRLAQIQGVYVPSLYAADYHSDGTLAAFAPIDPVGPAKITKRINAVLPPPLTHFIVPSVEVVHNRVAVEIQRGCTRGCRFCHAGQIMRPVRERPVEEVVQAVEEALDATGYEEVALLSLSSSDYTHIVELVSTLTQRMQGRRLTISLPSLRIESFSVALMDQLKENRPGGGFTLAPEAASERMRQIINKPVSTDQLLDTARDVFRHGWTSLKLYFMIGHPSETLDDVRAIVDVCKKVLAIGRQEVGFRAKVHAGVSTFVPKPHTPFQWVACDTMEQIRAKQDLLRNEMRNPNLKLTWSEPEDTFLEAWLARGDRRMSEVIFTAWQNGARFDAWQDHFHYDTWLNAFSANGLDPDFYVHRPRALDEMLPWDHISTGVRKSYLQEEYNWSLEGKIRGDCRDQCYACGILPTFNEQRLLHPGDAWKCPEVKPRQSAVEVNP
jgi:radical SAM family uncharacterized protein